ncbi:MAG: protein tyrosine phosphatase family protein [Sphingomonadales bacterium]
MVDPGEIFAWHRLGDRLTTSGQPTEEQLAGLRAIGVQHIINLALHTHEKASADEASSVSALGMIYTHIPVAFDAPTEQDYASFCSAMASAGGAKVHVHCIMNFRVSAFLFRYRQEFMGVTEPLARAEMENIWQPGGVWAAFVGDEASVELPHRGPRI